MTLFQSLEQQDWKESLFFYCRGPRFGFKPRNHPMFARIYGDRNPAAAYVHPTSWPLRTFTHLSLSNPHFFLVHRHSCLQFDGIHMSVTIPADYTRQGFLPLKNRNLAGEVHFSAGGIPIVSLDSRFSAEHPKFGKISQGQRHRIHMIIHHPQIMNLRHRSSHWQCNVFVYNCSSAFLLLNPNLLRHPPFSRSLLLWGCISSLHRRGMRTSPVLVNFFPRNGSKNNMVPYGAPKSTA